MKNVIYGLVLSLTLVACNAQEDSSTQLTTSDGVALAVYKSETCGCCGIWTDYMAGHGYDIAIHHPADLNEVKQRFGIDPQWQSCHTAVTDDGYFFEGHIPERFVKQFLTAPPANAAGLSVPGMPVGSPGMEVGDRFMAYDIVLINKDGTTATYARVETASDQF